MARPRSHPIWWRAAEVCVLYEGGMSMMAIADLLGTKYSNVRAVLLDRGVKIRSRRNRGPRAETVHKVRRIRQLRAKGFVYADIGALMGMSAAGAYKLERRPCP